MKFLFILIAPIFSLKCSNCKHFMIGKPDIFIFGKCNLFPKTKDVYSLNNKKESVKTKTIEDRYYCSTAREYSGMCGVEGKFYESK